MEMNKAIEQIVKRKIDTDTDFQYVFLLGAGCSITCGIPGGDKIIEQFKEEFNIDEEKIIKVKTDTQMTDYQAVLTLCYEMSPSRTRKILRDIIKSTCRESYMLGKQYVINNCYDVLANILSNEKTKGFSRAVLTTNFDPLLNYALIQSYNEEPILIRNPREIALMETVALFKEFPVLYYLHGYWQNNSQYHCTDQMTDFCNEWLKRLESFQEKDIIVLGYSGIEDSLVMEWLKNRLEYNNGSKIWWCVYTKDKKMDIDLLDAVRGKLACYDDKKLIFLPIPSADDFMLSLGSALGIEHAKNIQSIKSIFPWFMPSSYSVFANGATIKPQFKKQKMTIEIKMSQDGFSSNNHAGINIETMNHGVDLSKYNHFKIVYKTETQSSGSDRYGFEFKLHSKNAAWSYHLPFPDKNEKASHSIPLECFREKGVDIKKVWRIVIAADVNCLGKNGEGSITIYNCELLS